MNKLQAFTKNYIKTNVPSLRAGDTIKVYEIVKEGDKNRIQVFEGLVIARKHGTKGPNATFTVRKISGGVGVEKTYPLHSPIIQKIEVVKHDKVRRGKLYYVRHLTGKKRKKRASKMLGVMFEEAVQEPQSNSEEKIAENETAPAESQEKETQNQTGN